jgi:PRTRC genetic system ThiF family protein
MNNKPRVHFVDNYLLQPTNPVAVNVIGAGGTGSHMQSALARINYSLVALGHAGLRVNLYDDDRVSTANLGRQLFSEGDVGQNKASVLINRTNRFFSKSQFKAVPFRYNHKNKLKLPQHGAANIIITCVDTVQARIDIAEMQKEILADNRRSLHRPMYWLDLGNSKYTAQAILSTIGEIEQPPSKKYLPIDNLPFVTEAYANLLQQSEDSDDTPTCSLAEALSRQDLFINSTLANMASSLLWNLFREGIILHKGFFLNLKNFKSTPIPV